MRYIAVIMKTTLCFGAVDINGKMVKQYRYMRKNTVDRDYIK